MKYFLFVLLTHSLNAYGDRNKDHTNVEGVRATN